jgi:type I restriction enzyme S subunit
MCSVGNSLYDGESILLPRKGSLSNIQYYNGAFWTVDTCFYSIVNRECAVPYYLYLYLKNLDLSGLDTGASIPSMTTGTYYGITVKLPSISYQDEVADIIQNYDTLIDTNTKRIKLLEESARELYKEWFVRMRFPGYEQTKFVKGIPEGWKVVELKELVTTQYGLTTTSHSQKDNDNDAYYLRITDIVDNNINWAQVPYCTSDDDVIRKYKLWQGDILVARTGATVGYATQIQKIPYEAVFASYLIRLKAKNKLHISYIGMSVVSDIFRDYIQSIATGAAQPMANPHLMTSFKLLLPSEHLLKHFNEHIDSVNDIILNLQLQNQELASTRDRLLPRLLNGELKVKA